MEPEPFAVEVGSLNHWTTREVPDLPSLKKKKKKTDTFMWVETIRDNRVSFKALLQFMNLSHFKGLRYRMVDHVALQSCMWMVAQI